MNPTRRGFIASCAHALAALSAWMARPVSGSEWWKAPAYHDEKMPELAIVMDVRVNRVIRWIPVTERMLPKEKGIYIVASASGRVSFLRISADGWRMSGIHNSEITHWAEMPAAPHNPTQGI